MKSVFGLLVVAAATLMSLGARADDLDQQRAKLREVRAQIPGLIATLKQDEARLGADKEGLTSASHEAIHSWITAAIALDSVADLFQSYLAVHVLKWGDHNLQTLEAARHGKKDPQGLIASQDDLLSWEDLYNIHAVKPGAVYSGSAPSERGMRWLKKKGITAIINFRKDDAERAVAAKVGLRYYHVPIADHLPPSEEQAKTFLQIVSNEEKHGGRVYHHCLRGVGRDQTMAALVHINDGQSVDEAIAEGVKTAPGWVVDQGHAEHGEDASAAEVAKYKDSKTPQFDFLRRFAQDQHAVHR